MMKRYTLKTFRDCRALRICQLYRSAHRPVLSRELVFVFDDWHEHDGIILPAKPLTINELSERVVTPHSLCQWGQGDFKVYRAVYPDSFDFLLRVNVVDEDDDPKEYPVSGVRCPSRVMVSTLPRFGSGLAASPRSNSYTRIRRTISTESMPDNRS